MLIFHDFHWWLIKKRVVVFYGKKRQGACAIQGIEDNGWKIDKETLIKNNRLELCNAPFDEFHEKEG